MATHFSFKVFLLFILIFLAFISIGFYKFSFIKTLSYSQAKNICAYTLYYYYNPNAKITYFESTKKGNSLIVKINANYNNQKIYTNCIFDRKYKYNTVNLKEAYIKLFKGKTLFLNNVKLKLNN